ncbi:hypothetical protein BDW75DRAFT_235763 [Aspergillus navahoensis]
MPPRRFLRRPHKKSRLGCQESDRRHVKVRSLTARPSSVRVSRPYLSTAVDPTDTTPVTVAPSPVSLGPFSDVLVPLLSIPSTFCPDSTTIPSVQSGAFQFILDTGPSVYEGWSIDHESFRAIMPAALSSPYAMYQILALSALHLSHTRTAQASHYREEATFLQTKALSGFLNRFVRYLNLHRGVPAVTSESWQLLLHSNISSMLNRAERTLHAASLQSQEQATFVADRLHSLLNDADMGPESQQICGEAVESLQLVYQSESSRGETPPEKAPGLIWTWPSLLSGVFTNLLMKRRPEALIILCHYALLHRRRHIWLVRNACQMLISEITRSLGTYWLD